MARSECIDKKFTSYDGTRKLPDEDKSQADGLVGVCVCVCYLEENMLSDNINITIVTILCFHLFSS